ncbi:MAG TPA: S-layer homology domain-containing protein [Microcoleus sp.]|nr:S-layer homology domain-containing protein [Microcoleus sp.]
MEQAGKPVHKRLIENGARSQFIQTLAEKGIVTGYLDKTFRSKQAMDHDEFAAMIRQAFERAKIRKIPRGSAFTDFHL